MPLVRVGRDLGLAEAAHLGADRLQGVVEAGVADGRRALRGPDQGHEAGAVLGRVALVDEGFDRIGAEAGGVPAGEAEGVRAHDLALAHRDASKDLVEVLADADAGQKLFRFAEPALGAHALGVGREFAHRDRVGGQPCEPVRRLLLGLQPIRGDAPIDGDARPNAAGRLGDEPGGIAGGLSGERQDIGRRRSDGGQGGHGGLRTVASVSIYCGAP